MEDPDIVNAAGTVAASIIALGALLVSIIGLVKSVRASQDAQNARESATLAQWKMSEHLELIAEAQAEVAQNLTSGVPQAARRSGGKLSGRLVNRGRSQWSFVVANVGVEAVTMGRIEEGQGAILDLGRLEGAELEPGEDLSVPAALTLGMELPLAVTLRWEDSLGEHERVQTVTPD